MQPLQSTELSIINGGGAVAKMSFFASSSFVFAGSVNLKQQEDKMQVKLIQGSVRTLPNDYDSGNRNKFGVPSRPKKMKNRKINLDFRSVWYDGSSDEKVYAAASPTSVSYGSNLRKAASLDSLLEPGTTSRRRRQLTKDMISAPRSPRKIENWNDFVGRIDAITELNSSKERLAEKIGEENDSDDLIIKIGSMSDDIEQLPRISPLQKIKGSNSSGSEATEDTIDEIGQDTGVRKENKIDIDLKIYDNTGADEIRGNIDIDEDLLDWKEIILRKKNHDNIPEVSNRTGFHNPKLPSVRASMDFSPSARSNIDEDIIRKLKNDAFLKVQTLDRYHRKNILKPQLSFPPPRHKTVKTISGDFNEGITDNVTLDIPKTKLLVGAGNNGVHLKRILFELEDFPAPIDSRHALYVKTLVAESSTMNSLPVYSSSDPTDIASKKNMQNSPQNDDSIEEMDSGSDYKGCDKIETTPAVGCDQNYITTEIPNMVEDVNSISKEDMSTRNRNENLGITIGNDISTHTSKLEKANGHSNDDIRADNPPQDNFRTNSTSEGYHERSTLKTQLSTQPPGLETMAIVSEKFNEKTKSDPLQMIDEDLDVPIMRSEKKIPVEIIDENVGVPITKSSVDGVKGNVKFKRKPIRKEDISAPFNFRHVRHFGARIEKRAQEVSNLSSMKYLSKSTDEVLRTLQTNKDEPVSRGVGPFPRTDDSNFLTADVQIRSNRHGTNRGRQSKTMDFDVPRRSPSKTQDFDVKGVTKIQLPSSNSPLKLEKNEYIKYQNNTIFTANDSLGKLEPLRTNVILKSMKSLNKREVELRDSANQVYIFIFDSSKDAKHFMESEKVNNLLDNKTTLSKTLLRLLGKRSSREVLEKKGIYQNEPIFGNTLRNIFHSEKGVPEFITKTMRLIESPENVTSLGLYRACGNLATIQKIRLEVDKGNLDILDAYAKDPDVLTGGLKLFFRELKEPLMSCQTCDHLLGIMRNDKNYSSKDKSNIRTILSHLPEANSETLSVLLRHLVLVVKYKDQNKMDSYNLATCWGPTVIFATESADSAFMKDLVTQSAEATRLFDSLLTYYSMYPEELDFQKRKHDYLDTNKNMLHREDSKDSIHSSDSNSSKLQKKSSSSLSLEGIDEAVKKCVELIENAGTDGVHKKSGSTERVNKIVKKMAKKKTSEMDKYKNDVYELIEALKKYLKQESECLITKEAVEQIKKICDNKHCLEHSTRQRVISVIRDLPKKETFIFLLRHLMKIIDKESTYRDTKTDLLSVWAKVLIPDHSVESEEVSTNFLKNLSEVFDETKSDIGMKQKGIPDGLLDDLKNHPNMKDRISKYDNVPDESDFYKEETIFEEKTDGYENTKL